MKKLLLILAVISLIIPIAYFNWVLYTVDGFGNYFRDMYNLLTHWTSGEMGWWQIYPIIFGVILLLIRANIDKLISDFNRGYVDAMSDD